MSVTIQEYSTRAKAMVGKRKEEFDAFVKTVPRSDILRYNRVQKSKGKHCIRLKTPGRPLTGFMAHVSLDLSITLPDLGLFLGI